MQTSDLKNVLISAIETADGRLLSMLYAVIKTYQITENQPAAKTAPVRDTPKSEPVAKQTERKYKDDRPRRVVRIYRKPKENVVEAKVATKIVATETPVAAPRVIRVAASDAAETPKATVRKSQDTVSGRSNNGGFITDLMTKTVSKNGLPA